MTDPTEDLDPPAVLDQPTWKPKHRVDVRRPANPHTADPELEDLYQDFYKSRTGPNLTIGLILLVVFLLAATAGYMVGTWLS